MPTDTFSPETRGKYQGSPLWKPWMGEIRLRQATSLEDLEEFLQANSHRQYLSWDIETCGLEPYPEETVGHSISFDGNEALYIPVRHKVNPEQNLDPDRVAELFVRAIENKILVVYNYMFEGVWLGKYGVRRKSTLKYLNDAMIFRWLYDSDARKFGLKDSARELCGCDMLEIDEVPGVKLDKRKRGRIDFSLSDPEQAALYAAADVVFALRVLEKVRGPVESRQKTVLAIEHKLMQTMLKMRDNPVWFDRAFLRRGEQDLDRWMAISAGRVYERADYTFNINAPNQFGHFLKKLGVPLREKTKKGDWKADEETLTEFEREFPVIQDYLTYKGFMKEKTTYIHNLMSQTSEEKPYGYLNTRSVGTTTTGRFAGGQVSEWDKHFIRNINPQNIPSSDKYVKAPCRLVHNPPLDDMDCVIDYGLIPGDKSKTRETPQSEEVKSDGEED